MRKTHLQDHSSGSFCGKQGVETTSSELQVTCLACVEERERRNRVQAAYIKEVFA